MTRTRCNKYDTSAMCEGRKYATQNGSFGYDPKRRGYYSTDLPPLSNGLPLILEGCPYCFEELASHFLHLPKPKPAPPTMPSGEMDVTAGDDE